MIQPKVLFRTLAGAALAMGLAASCKAKFAPEEPTGVISEACCKVVSKDLQSGAGCRATGKCASDEKIWMRGAVTCSPLEPERCVGGRCCTYRRMYGSDDALYNWDEGGAEPNEATNDAPPAPAPPAAAPAAEAPPAAEVTEPEAPAEPDAAPAAEPQG